MTHTERKALAAQRLAKLAQGEWPYTQQAEPVNQRAADSAVDRGLAQWWL